MKIGCLLVDFPQHLHRQRGQPGFGAMYRLITWRAVALSVTSRWRSDRAGPCAGVVDRPRRTEVVVAHELNRPGPTWRGCGVGSQSGRRAPGDARAWPVMHLRQRAADVAHLRDAAAPLLDVNRSVRAVVRRQRRVCHLFLVRRRVTLDIQEPNILGVAGVIKLRRASTSSPSGWRTTRRGGGGVDQRRDGTRTEGSGGATLLSVHFT